MAPVSCRVVSYVSIREPSWPALHKNPIIPVGRRVAAPPGVGPPDWGDGIIRTSSLRRSLGSCAGSCNPSYLPTLYNWAGLIP